MKILKLTMVVIFLNMVVCRYAISAVICGISPTYPSYISTLPLTSANITVGPDTPDGTIIYAAQFPPPTPRATMECTASSLEERYSWNKYIKIESAPTGLTGWSNSQFTNVYDSGVPGIGIVIWKGSVGLTENPYLVSSYSSKNPAENLWVSYDMDTNFSFGLIKYGNIVPGTVNGAKFPTVLSAVTNNSGISNLPPDVVLARINFSGAINIVSQTCTTPANIPVNLGDYPFTSFNQVGTTTPWVDASITLTNCPRFYGYYPTTNEITIPNSGSPTVPSATKNSLLIAITPNTSVIDSANGVMAVNSTGEGAAATGVGIQLALGSPSSSLTPFNFSGMTYTLSSNDGNTITIPLSARYIQTGTTVKPGRADGVATYLINYY